MLHVAKGREALGRDLELFTASYPVVGTKVRVQRPLEVLLDVILDQLAIERAWRRNAAGWDRLRAAQGADGRVRRAAGAAQRGRGPAPLPLPLRGPNEQGCGGELRAWHETRAERVVLALKVLGRRNERVQASEGGGVAGLSDAVQRLFVLFPLFGLLKAAKSKRKIVEKS